jgi:hypothetical protein
MFGPTNDTPSIDDSAFGEKGGELRERLDPLIRRKSPRSIAVKKIEGNLGRAGPPAVSPFDK